MPSLLPEPVPQVPLPHAPLDLVLCQLRFPDVPTLEERGTAEALQQLLNDQFPVLRQGHQESVDVRQSRDRLEVGAKKTRTWRLEQVDRTWFLTFNRRFVALNTHSYSSREDFIERLIAVLDALQDVATPTVCDRIGMRYIDRVTDIEILDNLEAYVNPALLGVSALPTTENVRLEHSFNDILLHLDHTARLRARCGIMPPDAQPDPSLKPHRGPSWVLDLDVFDADTKEFSLELAHRAEELAEAAYQMFRWCVTDKFIEYFGGRTE